MPYRIHIRENAGENIGGVPPSIVAMLRRRLNVIADAAEHFVPPRPSWLQAHGLGAGRPTRLFIRGFWMEYTLNDEAKTVTVESIGRAQEEPVVSVF